MSKSYVVGIGGGTCSGKSTLTGILQERFAALEPVIFNMDRYFIKPASITIAPITGREYPEFNHPDALDKETMFADIRKAIADGAKLIIIEGLFALHYPEILELLDLKVFVDLKSDARLVRRIIRHEQRGDTFKDITDRYIDTVRFRHDEFVEPTRWRADLVLNGTLAGKEADILETYIRSML